MTQKNLKRIIFGFFTVNILILVFIFGFVFGYRSLLPTTNVQAGQVKDKNDIPEYLSQDVDFNEFWQIWNYVKGNYVKSDIPETQLFYGALSGVVASLGDPYSVFFSPDINKQFEEELSGNFEGIGAEIGIRDDHLAVIAPLPNTPAAKAGLKAGDYILKIDDLDATNISLDLAVSKIRGKKGTPVVLSVFTEGDQQPHDVTITRDKIEIDSVRLADSKGQTETGKPQLLDGGIAYIQLLYFNENTLADWNKTVQEILALNPKGIILDLRNNPGGYLSTAIEVAGEWVDGKTVVKEQLRDGSKIEHRANGQALFAGIPTVVLVNGGSASGSEIVAGALQDYGVAKLVGETTFGKGSVQDVRNFSDGSAVKLTIAEWLTPKDRNINHAGITPDVEVKMTQDDYNAGKDPQLDKAIESLK
ncbi:MAG: S41 family peptidase [Candidatus Buchananbacteria bacterium]|nr:S41 family peptidase [Candidatus Buchananbacteria bacterium]